MTAAVTPTSVTLSRHPIAVLRQAARLAGSLVVPALGPRCLDRDALAVRVAVTPPGVVRPKLKLAVHAVLHLIHAVLHLIHAVLRRRHVVQALILESLPIVPVPRVSLLKARGILQRGLSEAPESAGRRSASIGRPRLVVRVVDPREVRGFLAVDLTVERL